LLFGIIDQAKLASGAGIELSPSTLIVNPPLGVPDLETRCGPRLASSPLGDQGRGGQVLAMYQDIAWIVRRLGTKDRSSPAWRQGSEAMTSEAIVNCAGWRRSPFLGAKLRWNVFTAMQRAGAPRPPLLTAGQSSARAFVLRKLTGTMCDEPRSNRRSSGPNSASRSEP
jgi:hypothetical protein